MHIYTYIWPYLLLNLFRTCVEVVNVDGHLRQWVEHARDGFTIRMGLCSVGDMLAIRWCNASYFVIAPFGGFYQIFG